MRSIDPLDTSAEFDASFKFSPLLASVRHLLKVCWQPIQRLRSDQTEKPPHPRRGPNNPRRGPNNPHQPPSHCAAWCERVPTQRTQFLSTSRDLGVNADVWISCIIQSGPGPTVLPKILTKRSVSSHQRSSATDGLQNLDLGRNTT